MFSSFAEMLKQAKSMPPVTISVSVAQDADVLEAVKAAQTEGIATAILVGDASKIRPLIQEIGLPADTPIIDQPDAAQAALAACSLVQQGQAQILMKGMINSSDFLRAVLNSTQGLRTGRLLSHMMAFDLPSQQSIFFHSDGGMNIAPTLAEKKDILVNAVLALHGMGVSRPHVAVLTANEVVSPKMPATLDAQALAEFAITGEVPDCLVEGPIALDVAINPAAAAHKGIKSQISGNVDLFLMPNIEAGNIAGKSLMYYAGAKAAGIVLGATHPVVMTSRAETAEGKLNSIALARLIYGKG